MKEIMQIQMASWAAMIKDRADSGLTVQDWCAQNNVSKHAYYYRLRQLRNKMLEAADPDHLLTKGDTPCAVSFAKLPAAVTSNTAEVALRIRRGDTTLEVSNDASEDILSLMREVMLRAL